MNDSEHRVFVQHPVVGAGVLIALEPLQGAANLIHHQHENFDGSGFPYGLKGEAIPLGARILKAGISFTENFETGTGVWAVGISYGLPW